ncbi:hypothetical protein ACFCZ3_02275 [Cellulosimicrobium cellulans]|uniref:hypothetical protein n=1 Tax=Cellulosimicrobium cellulans TaxID=1710 RepID=UPI0035DF0696
MREPVQQDWRRPVLPCEQPRVVLPCEQPRVVLPCEQPRVVLPVAYLSVSSFLAGDSGGPVV